MKRLELAAPAGNAERLRAAVYFGADAVYFAGKSYGLRAGADNFTDGELAEAVKFLHENNRKAYITLNIFARNGDFDGLDAYLQVIADTGADAVIVSDIGMIRYIKKRLPGITVHVSTQANVTNKYSAEGYAEAGAGRIVLARELSLPEIREIRDYLPENVELEAFAHGAMCIAYSGRCLLSSYLAGRDSNRGECVQACRWEYNLNEVSRDASEPLTVEEDGGGTYILNSKDLNMLGHLDKMIDAGITSFKIEGRMKTAYYVANTVNAYRRALDIYKPGEPYSPPEELINELYKSAHRRYTTGFYLPTDSREDTASSAVSQDAKFIAAVLEGRKGSAIIEMRNKFAVGDTLEVLSPGPWHNAKINVTKLTDLDGADVRTADRVQQRLILYTDVPIKAGDILRTK
jgi:putative protease